MVASEILPILNNYFLAPKGLVALTALIPLVIFYLIKKKPDEEVMPSMMFFRKDKKSGKVMTAFRKLLRNLILLLHILIVIGLSAALAHPFIQGQESSKNAVLILDQSASMGNDFKEAKNFLKSNSAEQNTLITVEEEVRVLTEKEPGFRLSSEIEKLNPKDTETDIVSGLKTARSYKGDIIVASDLDQTVNDKDPEKIVKQIRNKGRKVKVMETSGKNSWGIVELQPGSKTSKIDIKNFKETKRTIEININGNTQEVSIKGGSVRTVDAPMKEGLNTVKLPRDSFEKDNKAFISVPKEANYRVVFISDKENPYLGKAFELISFTSFQRLEPPIQQEIQADIYIVGKSSQISSATVRNIESDVKGGAGLILFSSNELFELGFSSLPAERKTGSANRTVSIQKPVRTTLRTEVMNVKKTGGEEYSSGSNGIIKSNHGNGEVLFYNIKDSDFRHKFLYPVFWKRIVREMMDQPSIEELNLETGQEIQEGQITTPSGDKTSGIIRMETSGFYNGSRNIYAANLLSEDESFSEDTEKNFKRSLTGGKTKKDIQHLLGLVLGILMLGELSYLKRIGEIS